MLTLFKPWRHGKDLKNEDQSWDDVFSNHKFTPRQQELMKYFNIRYECNDARDDYSKLLKEKTKSGGVFPHWFNAANDGDFDDDLNDDQGDYFN
jgi:hypothetical protein